MLMRTISVSLLILLMAVVGFTQEAADFTLKDMNGNDVSFADHKGKVVLVNFWATWCPPCRHEIPHFIELMNELGDKGFVVLGISMDGDAGTVTNWLKDNPVNYPIMMADDAVTNTYKAYLPEEERGYIPFTFIIDKRGKIQHHVVGYKDKASWAALINPLL